MRSKIWRRTGVTATGIASCAFSMLGMGTASQGDPEPATEARVVERGSLASFPLRMERPDDPPVAPSRLGQRTVEPARVWSRGVFNSIQVNVDALGNNIIGDAGNEPSIAIDATNPDNMVIGWRQFDTVASNFRTSGNAYSHDRGQTWTFPGVLEPGVFSSDPVLASDADGNIYYYALQSGRGPGSWACYLYKSGDAGLTWPQERYAFGGDKAWLTIDRTLGPGRGFIYVAWSPFAGCCPGFQFTRSTNGGVTFIQPISLPPQQFFGTLTVDPDGVLYVAGGVNWPNGPFAVSRSTNAQNVLQTPTFDFSTLVDLDGFFGFSIGPNPAGLLGQVSIVSDHSHGPTHGNLYLLCSVIRSSVSDPMDVMFSRSTDRGQTWSVATRVNDDPLGNNAWQWFGTTSVAPNGRIDVVWNDTRNTGVTNLSELFYTYSEDAGVTWSTNIAVSPVFDSWVGWPNQNKLGDYYDMISDNGGASLAYAATFNGEQDVYSLRIEQACGLGPPDAAAAVPGGVTKGRYISFVPGNPGQPTALRVTFSDLPAGFEEFEGTARWVGPPHEISEFPGETDDTPPVFVGAKLQCQPHYMDWSTVGVVHVFDRAIVPAARYDVQAVRQGCPVTFDANYSAPLEVLTSVPFGDVAGTWDGAAWTAPDRDVDFDDIPAVVDKFRDLPGAPSKTRTDLAGDTPNLKVDFDDIATVVDAFRGLYLFDGPSECP